MIKEQSTMKKLLIDKYANLILFDESTNSIEELPEECDISTAFVAEEDGQAISRTEVVNYKAGDLVIVFRAYKKDNWLNKTVVCNDVFAKDDVVAWYKSLKTDNEAI